MEEMENKDTKQEEVSANNKPSTKTTGKTETKKSQSTKKKSSILKRKISSDSKLKKQLEENGLKLAEIQDKYLRLSAEYDNYRKRTLKEKMELTKTGGERVLLNILPILDNLDRATVAIQEAKDIKAIKVGIELIATNFSSFSKQNGLKEIEAMNAEFDTDLHEAITKIPAPSEDLKGKVVDVIEKGYYLYDKVIRFAKVVVGE